MLISLKIKPLSNVDTARLKINNKNLILPPGFSNFFTVLHATFCILVDEFQDP